MKKGILVIFLSLLFSGVISAEVSFRASAPNTVAAGQTFQLVYTVNDNGKDFRLPSVSGFDILAGPYTSTSSSTSIINGKVSSSKEIRYTYTLQALKEGQFTIAAATIVVDGQKYSSNPVSIKVLPEDKAASAAQSSGRSQGGTASTTQVGTPDRLFIRANFSRTKVMEQEAILVTYKLYSKDDIVGFESVKLPDFKDFMVQEIELPQNRQLQRENYNGSNFLTYEIYKGILFPQHSGTIHVDKFQCTVGLRVRVQRQSRSFFDSFFDSYQDVEKTISSPGADIQVSSLPKPKPADFSGVVGTLSLDRKVSETSVTSNTPVTVTLTLSGSGNLKMLKTPELNFPADFEVYEPKVTNNFTTSASGQQGKKVIEYLVIPRHKGEFTVPGTTISYYDTNSKSYKTLNTGEIKFSVAKGEGDDSGASTVAVSAKDQERVEMLASDIRYLSNDGPDIRAKEDYFIGTLLYWLLVAGMLVLTTALAILFRKQAKDNADVALMKNRKANKIAKKRLKVAEKEWKAGHREQFYDEILKALWGYTSDKLSIPMADLNRENIHDTLIARKVNEEVTEQFVNLLDECQFQRYAPMGDEKKAMDKTFEETIDLISKLEDNIRK